MNDKKSRAVATGLIILAFALLAIGFIGAYLTNRDSAPVEPTPPSSSEQLTMPDVIGMKAEDAVELLGWADNLKLVRANGAEILFLQGFTVDGQSPDAGYVVEHDTEIVLTCLSDEEMS